MGDVEKITADDATITSLISSLIKDEWEAVDGYNSALISMSAMGYEDPASEIIQDIISEEYVHIGQLEKLLQSLMPISNDIDDGRDEAEEFVDEEEPEEDEEEDQDNRFVLSTDDDE